MNDHFAASDHTGRNTYRAWVAHNEGVDRELHPNNQGRYGFRGRGPDSEARHNYWRIATEVVACWTAPRVIVNVKDYSYTARDGTVGIEPIVDDWARLLEQYGYVIAQRIKVPTPGLRYGANHDARVGHEVILDAPDVVAKLPPGFSDVKHPNFIAPELRPIVAGFDPELIEKVRWQSHDIRGTMIRTTPSGRVHRIEPHQDRADLDVAVTWQLIDLARRQLTGDNAEETRPAHDDRHYRCEVCGEVRTPSIVRPAYRTAHARQRPSVSRSAADADLGCRTARRQRARRSDHQWSQPRRARRRRPRTGKPMIEHHPPDTPIQWTAATGWVTGVSGAHGVVARETYGPLEWTSSTDNRPAPRPEGVKRLLDTQHVRHPPSPHDRRHTTGNVAASSSPLNVEQTPIFGSSADASRTTSSCPAAEVTGWCSAQTPNGPSTTPTSRWRSRHSRGFLGVAQVIEEDRRSVRRRPCLRPTHQGARRTPRTVDRTQRTGNRTPP